MYTNIKIIIILSLLFLVTGITKPCNICGGGTGDIVVLALDGRALVNLGFTYDSYLGIWDSKGEWRETPYKKDQARFSMGVAYRLNKRLQFGASIPYVYNKHNVPGLPENGTGIGDISLSGRYEIFHEYQLVRRNNKTVVDTKIPYLALTFGLTVPTGKSDEDAKNEVDITGKGYYMSSLGISVTKSIIKNRLQISSDFSWQHCFKKTYEKYFGEELSTSFSKSPGDKYNYSVSLNYIFNNWHALTLTASGFSQSSYYVNNTIGFDSDERNLSFLAAYTFYPSVPFRITPSLKWTIPNDDMGKNATGSTTFTVNFTYYFEDYNIR